MNYFSFGLLVILLSSCVTERTRQVKILGTTISYREFGTGVPLVILPGGGLDKSSHDFDQCIPALSKKFHLILPDGPGQAESEQPDTLTYQLLTEYYSRFIDSLNVDSTYIMGWSDGGIASLLLAERKPEKVKRVIAVGANNGLIGALPPDIDITTVIPQPLDVWATNNKKPSTLIQSK